MMENPIDWGAVIIGIKKEKKLPLKTIAAKIGASHGSLKAWREGVNEPRFSMGAKLLILAGWEIKKC